MSKFKRIVVIVATFIVLGAIAKIFNTTNHERMALEQCGTKENIKRIDSVGFECINELKN
jgi:hypothetical protein